MDAIKEWDTGNYKISKSLKERITGNERKDKAMKVVFKEVDEPGLREVEDVEVACLLYD